MTTESRFPTPPSLADIATFVDARVEATLAHIKSIASDMRTAMAEEREEAARREARINAVADDLRKSMAEEREEAARRERKMIEDAASRERRMTEDAARRERHMTIIVIGAVTVGVTVLGVIIAAATFVLSAALATLGAQ